MKPEHLSTARLVIFDLDGVIYRGDEVVPGAADLVNGVRRAGRLVSFATNNSMATRHDYVRRLARHGIEAALDEIVTSSSATVEHLRSHLPEVQRVLAVGADGLLDELRGAGLRRHRLPGRGAGGLEWRAAARPLRRGGGRPRPADRLSAAGYRRRGNPCRSALHRHQRRRPIPDAGWLRTGRRHHRRRTAGDIRRHPAGHRQAAAGDVPGNPGARRRPARPGTGGRRQPGCRHGRGSASRDRVGAGPDRSRRPLDADGLAGERRPDHVASGPAEVAELLGVAPS